MRKYTPSNVIPAKAGINFSAIAKRDRWLPAFAGMTALFLLLIFFSSPARADCSNPSDAAGVVGYNSTVKEMQYCDGTNWISMGIGPGTGGGCASPAGVAGDMGYNTDYRVPQYCNGHEWVAMGPTLYRAQGVHFDTATYLQANSMVGVTNSKKVTFSLWFRLNNLNAGGHTFLATASHGLAVGITGVSNKQITITGNNGTDLSVVTTSAVISDLNWHHILLSLDMSDSSKLHLYLDDTEITALTVTTFNDNNLAFNGSTALAENIWAVDMADLWVDYGTYMDLTQTGNRRKFISAAGAPVYLGADGSVPTGTQPEIFFTGDPSTWNTNKGTAGGFNNGSGTVTGSTIVDSLSNGLVGWWKLDETSGTTAADSSGNGNDGILTDMSASSVNPYWLTGVKDGALELYTTNSNGQPQPHVEVPKTTAMDSLASAYTFASWVRVYNPNFFTSGLIASDVNNAWDIYNYYNVVSGNFRVFVRHNSTFFNSAWSFPIKQWFHLVVTWDGTTLSLYKDGTFLTSTATLPPPVISTATNLWIGESNSSGNRYSTAGMLDDVRLYNRALSPTEVQHLYGCTAPVHIEGTILYNSTHSVMQYCNGTDWVGIGK